MRGEGAEQISVGEEQGDLPQRKRHRATQRRGGCGGSFGARGARRMGARLRHLSCRVGRVASSQANRASLLAVPALHSHQVVRLCYCEHCMPHRTVDF